MKTKLWLALVPAVCLCLQTKSIHAQQTSGSEIARLADPVPALNQSAPCAKGSPAATGQIAGVLKDQTGAVVSGAKIEAWHLATGIKRTIESDSQGRFVFNGAQPGKYQVTATAAAFEIAIIQNVSVAACGEIKVDIVLKIAPANTDVVVVGTVIEAVAESIAAKKIGTSDTAAMFRGVPGLNLATNGGVSSLPVIHGLADDRLKVLVNGMTLTSHCANHMNPAMSYIDPGNVGRVYVMAGITPVSNGGDSIGGTIVVDSAEPMFAAAGQRLVTHSSITGFHRTNGVVSGGDASLSAATQNFSAAYTGTYVNAADYKNGVGARVISTLFASRGYNAQLAARRGNHLVTVGLGYQDIPGEGFVNARMDMLKNESRLANAHYRGTFPWGRIDARAFYEHTGHLMNLLADKKLLMNMDMPMDTMGSNLGYTFQADFSLSAKDVLRAGTDFHRYTLNDWWPASMNMVGSMGPYTLWNVRDGRRDRFGTYVEWEGRHGKGWTELLGVRSDVVTMNAGNVEGYNMCGGQMNEPAYCMMSIQKGSAAYYDDATAFNSVSHGRRDNNFDVTALGRYTPNFKTSFEFGYAHKTRSPSLYERYLWVKQSSMSVNMNGWFGDLNGYTGNLNLRPEAANTMSVSVGLHDAAQRAWELKLTPYLTFVQDYIDVARCPVTENGLGNACTLAKFNSTTTTLATAPSVTLKFGNYGARLFGLDASGRMPIGGNTRAGDFSLFGVLSYVQGRNTDPEAPGSPGQQPLYHMMPLNVLVTAEHNLGNWSNAFSLEAVDAKNDLQAVRLELHTPGYAIANVRTSYQRHIAEPVSLRFDAGIDNLTARSYVLPLGGRYYGPSMADIKAGNSVPGMGRSFHGGLTFQF